MNRFYHLKVTVCGELDDETQIVNTHVHPPIVEEIGLEIDWWPLDDLSATFPIHFVTERLKSLMAYEGFMNVRFTPIRRVKLGYNFLENYGRPTLPPFWLVKFSGVAGTDDFGLWENRKLIVSQKGLDFLRDNHVTHAEAIALKGFSEDGLQFDKK